MRLTIDRRFVAAALFALPASLVAQATRTPYQQLGRDVLRELIETNTADSAGSTTVAAEKLAARFRTAGFPAADIQIVGASPKRQNLIVRYRGSGARRPVLLLAHLDVVEARRADWSMDPFVLNERDGFFYGRGTLDVKGGAANLVAALLRLKQEKFTPDRDLILALTAGEESGLDNGVEWLLANRRALIDAEYCINVDAGGGELRGGKHTALLVQAAEKVYQSFTLTVHNKGGHSSLPEKNNAIYHLASALDRLSRFDFPARPSELSRAYFTAMAPLAGGGGPLVADMQAVGRGSADAAALARLSAMPLYNALLRTTCVATQLQGGHAENALPQTAEAVVNCRILPGEPVADVQRALVRVVADTQVAIKAVGQFIASPPSPLVPELFTTLRQVARSVWGELPLIPMLETGATDGLFLRNAGMPVYGVTGIFFDPEDIRAHGRDERIGVTAFYDGLEFTHQLLRAVASPTPRA